MKNIVIGALCFFLGVAVVLGYRYVLAMRRANPPASTQATQLSPTPLPTLALVPPSQAVSGILTSVTGTVQKLSRDENDFKDASKGAKILLGESIATKEKSSAVASINGITSVTFGPGAELVFANLFPTNMVFQQKSGKITYDVTDTGHPVAVRALHSLVSINSGSVIINIVDTDMSVTVASGSAKLALVDANNDTHVWELTDGHRANIDDASRQIYFVLPRKGY